MKPSGPVTARQSRLDAAARGRDLDKTGLGSGIHTSGAAISGQSAGSGRSTSCSAARLTRAGFEPDHPAVQILVTHNRALQDPEMGA